MVTQKTKALGADVLQGHHIVMADHDSGQVEIETGAVYKVTGPLMLVKAAEPATQKQAAVPEYVNQRTKGQAKFIVMLDGKRVMWWLEADAAKGWVVYNQRETKGNRMVMTEDGTARKVFRSEGKVEIRTQPPTAAGNAGPENPLQ